MTVAVALLGASLSTFVSAEPRLPDTPPAENRIVPFSGDIPSCDDPFVLAQIQSDFWNRERNYWSSELALDSFEAPNELGFRTRGASFIPRRFCETHAAFNDGERRKVVYAIVEGGGFIGIGWGVEWCVDGLDRNMAYMPGCTGAGR
jgi:hypothetical protein